MAGYTKNQIEHFKEQLKLLMKSHNLTARKLSKEIGYSMNTISSLLTGKTKSTRISHKDDLRVF
nr:MAG TPA: Regulatory protein [Caudoviricetes sp.]